MRFGKESDADGCRSFLLKAIITLSLENQCDKPREFEGRALISRQTV
jgi:hypothetical protein